MNKQSITFKADEQKLIKTGGIEHYASNIVAYIEATFDLGANWNGYDSVRAVWSNDYLTDISTVLDSNGKCIVPTEVLTDTGNVTVNLVGSIADGDTLTDRLTTYPCKAVIVDADAKVEGEETENVTPSQFEQFVEIVHDEVEQVTGMTAEAETLPAGSDATASYSDGVLSFGIPKGDKGEQGEQGETGHTGEPAGFGDVTASVDNTVGTPSVNVTASGPDTAKEFDFEFHNLKGEQGDTGETGETGNGIASTVLNPDYTLTIRFTDGTSYTTPSIRGAKGDTGNTGATGNGIQSTVLNADYTLTITFTDGTSYTTPSIRGEQGPAGPVSDVTVNGTSVVDQNGVAVITMPELVKTVQGNPIVIDDAFGEVKNLDVELTPIQDLHGYDKPWSAGAGVNKYEPLEGVNNGVTWETLSDGTSKITGTAVATTWTYLMEVHDLPWRGITAGNKVAVYADNARLSLQYAIGEGAWTTLANASGNAVIVNLPAEATKIRLLQYPENQVSTSGTTFNKIAKYYLAQSDTFTEWTPYENICPITGHDSVTVGDTGVNQWDEQWEVGSYSDTTGEKIAGTRLINKNPIPIYPSTTYYLKLWSGAANDMRLLYYTANNEYISATAWTAQGTITTPSNAYYANFFLAGSYGQTYHNDISVNLPSTDTAYHAYYGQSKTVTLPHTVYGAGVGVTSGSGKEKMAMVDLGSLTWTYATSTQTFTATLTDAYNAGDQTKTTKANIVCSQYETVTNKQAYEGTVEGGIGLPYYNGSPKVKVKDSRFTDAATFKASLSGVQLCYKVNTPTDLTTTPTDLTLYSGDNVISSDGDMELTYVQDMAIVIEKLENLL